jgi:hypothetical protein
VAENIKIMISLARIQKFIPIITTGLIIWCAYNVGKAIGGGSSHRAAYIFMVFALCGAILYLTKKIGDFRLFCIFILFFWVPLDIRLYRFHPFLINFNPYEVCIISLLMVLLIKNMVFPNPGRRRLTLFMPMSWILILLGAVISNVLVGPFSESTLKVIRITWLIPLLTNILIFYYVRDVRRAKSVLLVFLSSASILGCIFLWAPTHFQNMKNTKFVDMVIDTLSSGRLTKVIDFPLFDPLYFNSETGAISYAFIAGTSFLLVTFSRSTIEKIAVLCFCGGSILVIVQSQGRGGFICFIVYVFTTLLLSSVSFRIRLKLLRNGLIVLGSAVISLGYYLEKSTSSVALARFYPLLTDPFSVHGFSDRVNRQIDAMDVYVHNPFFGVGVYGFPHNITGASWYAHNLYLYLLLSFGAIGFLGFILLLLQYAKLFFQSFKQKDTFLYCLIGLGCITGLLVAGLVSCVFSSIWGTLSFWIPLSVAAAVCKSRLDG